MDLYQTHGRTAPAWLLTGQRPAYQQNRVVNVEAVELAGILKLNILHTGNIKMWYIRNIKYYSYHWLCYCKICKLLRFLKIKK